MGPDILQEVGTTAISTASCSKLWKSWMPGMSFTMEQSQICFYNGKGGACQGDSGGPAICKKDGNWVLAGVTSGGSPVCNVKKPSVYTYLNSGTGSQRILEESLTVVALDFYQA